MRSRLEFVLLCCIVLSIGNVWRLLSAELRSFPAVSVENGTGRTSKCDAFFFRSRSVIFSQTGFCHFNVDLLWWLLCKIVENTPTAQPSKCATKNSWTLARAYVNACVCMFLVYRNIVNWKWFFPVFYSEGPRSFGLADKVSAHSTLCVADDVYGAFVS